MGINFETNKLNANVNAQALAAKALKGDDVTTEEPTLKATATNSGVSYNGKGDRIRYTEIEIMDDEGRLLEKHKTYIRGDKTVETTYTYAAAAPTKTDAGKIETKISAETAQVQQAAIKAKLPNAKKV